MASNSTKKLFFIAGERSGDLHSSNLIKAIKAQSDVEIIGWFGDYSQEAGGKLLKHYKDIAFMAFLEVLMNLRKISGFLKECQQQILKEKVDAVVLIDYGGFNLKIAEFCKKNNIQVHYYISPKVWAWNTKRAYKIKKKVDKLYCILPFEPDFFKKYDYETTYVGNPVVDAVNEFKENNKNIAREKVIAILPGSRKQEVTLMLDLMISVKDSFKDYKFLIAGVDNLDDELYEPAKKAGMDVIYDKTYDILSKAEAALVTSGTATLETAMFDVPQVVCYKTSKFNYAIAKRVIKVDHISLVNLIAGKEIVRELIQSNYNKNEVENELSQLLQGGNRRDEVLSGYEHLRKVLTDKNASQTTAKLILDTI